MTRRWLLTGTLLAIFALSLIGDAGAQAGKTPIKIGFGMALTGGLAGNGQAPCSPCRSGGTT